MGSGGSFGGFGSLGLSGLGGGLSGLALNLGKLGKSVGSAAASAGGLAGGGAGSAGAGRATATGPSASQLAAAGGAALGGAASGLGAGLGNFYGSLVPSSVGAAGLGSGLGSGLGGVAGAGGVPGYANGGMFGAPPFLGSASRRKLRRLPQAPRQVRRFANGGPLSGSRYNAALANSRWPPNLLPPGSQDPTISGSGTWTPSISIPFGGGVSRPATYYWGQPGLEWPQGTTTGPGHDWIEDNLGVTMPPIPGLFPGILASPNTGLQPGDTGFLPGGTRGPGLNIGRPAPPEQPWNPALMQPYTSEAQMMRHFAYHQNLRDTGQLSSEPVPYGGTLISRTLPSREFPTGQRIMDASDFVDWEKRTGNPWQAGGKTSKAAGNYWYAGKQKVISDKKQAYLDKPAPWVRAAKRFQRTKNLTDWGEVVRGYESRDREKYDWDPGLQKVVELAAHRIEDYDPALRDASGAFIGWNPNPAWEDRGAEIYDPADDRYNTATSVPTGSGQEGAGFSKPTLEEAGLDIPWHDQQRRILDASGTRIDNPNYVDYKDTDLVRMMSENARRERQFGGLSLDEGSYGPYDTTLMETMPRFLSRIERRQRRRLLGGREDRRSANQAAREHAATQGWTGNGE